MRLRPSGRIHTFLIDGVNSSSLFLTSHTRWERRMWVSWLFLSWRPAEVFMPWWLKILRIICTMFPPAIISVSTWSFIERFLCKIIASFWMLLTLLEESSLLGLSRILWKRYMHYLSWKRYATLCLLCDVGVMDDDGDDFNDLVVYLPIYCNILEPHYSMGDLHIYSSG